MSQRSKPVATRNPDWKPRPAIAIRNPRMQRHRMTGTIDGIVPAAIGGITILPPTLINRSGSEIKKGEPGGSPFLLICCVVSEAR